jgi:peptide/nickel transport system substrate-binding protein
MRVAVLASTLAALVVLGAASARPETASKYGGTLYVGLSADPDTLDPAVSMSSAATAIYPTICQSLYQLDAGQRLLPVLAAAAPTVSSDKLTYTIALRRGVEFNDGTPFNAEAVVTSVERLMAPDSPRLVDFASVESVSASGPYTVVFHLKARDSTLPNSLAGVAGIVMSPAQLAKLGTSFGTNPVCVGPFMFDHRVVGDSVTVIKSPYYYDQKDVYLDKIVFRPMPDGPSAAAALKAGDIQVLDGISTTELAAVKQASDLRVLPAYKPGWTAVLVNVGNKNGVGALPYTNVATPLASSAKLRQAFEEAIDRDALTRVVFDGLAQVSCSPIAPSNTLWYDQTRGPCTPYDPKDARKLVAASGFPSPTVHLLVRNMTDRIRLAQFIQAQEAAVGINVVIDTADANTVLSRASSGSFDTCLMAWAPADGDPDSIISPFLATSGPRNYSGYSNPRLDLVLANGLKATSMTARSTLYRTAQRIVSADRPLIVLDASIVFAGISTSVSGIRQIAGGNLSVENARYNG